MYDLSWGRGGRGAGLEIKSEQEREPGKDPDRRAKRREEGEDYH